MSQQRNSPAGVDGPHHDDRWPPQAISLAPNRKIGWPSHLRILMHAKIALMEISHEEDAGGQGANIVKSWVRPEGVGERAYKRREGAVLKRTSKSYINAQMTYWGGSFDEPRGGQLRLIKMTPKDTPEWDFDAPDAFIDLKKDEIAKLKGFLDEEFRRGGLGDTFWVSVPDQAIADALGRLLGDEEAQVVDVEKLTAAMSLNPELVASILKSDQAEIILQLRERSRRIEVLDELEWLIFHENTVESSFQKLLEKNPWVFGGEVVKADELRNIGTSDQIDIPIVRGDGSMVIVELKRAAATSIDRNDHGYPVLTGDVHLAVQQAQRYLYELDRLADTLMLKHGFDARRATALVVIGVSPDLPERESDKFRESFRIYNSHLARIQVTTYDQLLQNARRLTELRSPENTVNG